MINLLPIKEKLDIYKMYFVRRVIIALALLFVTVVVGIIFLLPSFFLVVVKEERLREQARDTIKTISSEDGMNIGDVIASTNTKLDILARDEGTMLSSVLASILEKKGTRIALSDFLFQKDVQDGNQRKKIVVKGESLNRETLISFADRLKRDPLFSLVDLPVSNLVKSKDIPFSITITLAE